MSVILAFLAKVLVGLLGAWLAEQKKTTETEKAGAQVQALATEAQANAMASKAQAASSGVATSDAKSCSLQLAEQSDPDNRDNTKPH